LLTLQEIKERLSQYDELTLLEVLDISSAELVDRFEDLIDEQHEVLAEELSDGYRSDDGHGE
jgi:hypothetical protein